MTSSDTINGTDAEESSLPDDDTDITETLDSVSAPGIVFTSL